MIKWLYGKLKLHSNVQPKLSEIGGVIDNPKFREIRVLQEKLWARKRVPKTRDEADAYWSDLSRLSALLIQLDDLPVNLEAKTKLQLAGHDVPPFEAGARWHYYRWCRVKMAQQLHREKKHKTALNLWFDCAFIDHQGLAFENAVYLGGIQNAVKRGKISETEAKAIFDDMALSKPSCNLEPLWKIIRKDVGFHNS